MEDFKTFLTACETGDVEKINSTLLHDIDTRNKYYINQGLLIASKLDNSNVVAYILKEIKFGYQEQINNLLDDDSDIINCTKIRMSGYVSDFFQSNINSICRCSVEVFKLFQKDFNGLSTTHLFGDYLRAASTHHNLPLIQYFLSTDEHRVFIEQWKYYHNYLDTKPEATEVAKYFLKTPELNSKIKPLQLLEKAYQNNNQELIEYLIFDYKMMYSKKTRKAVGGMRDGICNVPLLFENRDKILLAQNLNDSLEIKDKNRAKLKI